MNPTKPLAGQRALVTGASSGIGEGTALALAEAGADIVVNYRSDEAEAVRVVDAIRAKGVRAVAVKADISVESEVLTLFEQTRQQLGGLDILVNNAGIQRDNAFVHMTLEEWNQVISVNLTGHFLCAREACRHFLAHNQLTRTSGAIGKIIFIASVHDVIPWAGHVNYAASKGGAQMLMRSLAQELAHERIRVNSISPGAIRTNINRPAWETPGALGELLALIPYGRIGEPDDIGQAAVWLASDASDYITGTTLYVDGGMTLYPAFREGG